MVIAVEQTYCRAPLARSFNQTSGVRWIANINTSFSQKFGRNEAFQGDYESGRPDGFALSGGRIICVECKAAFEKFYLGEWSNAQRQWCRDVADGSSTPYYVAVWIGANRSKSGHAEQHALYMVPSRAILFSDQKSITFEDAQIEWRGFRVNKEGKLYVIKSQWWKG